MKTPRLVAATAASALVITALAACAAPEKGGNGDQTRSGMKVSEATSAADFGGMDALVEAAKKEGERLSAQRTQVKVPPTPNPKPEP